MVRFCRVSRLSRPFPLPPDLTKSDQQVIQKSISKNALEKSPQSDPNGPPMGTQGAPKFGNICKKVSSEYVPKKFVPKVAYSMRFRTPLDPKSDAPVQAGAQFTLFHLSRKCAPKVLPLPPFWHHFGPLNSPKAHKVPFKQ